VRAITQNGKALAFPFNLDVIFYNFLSTGHVPVRYICYSATPLQRHTSQYIRFVFLLFLVVIIVFYVCFYYLLLLFAM